MAIAAIWTCCQATQEGREVKASADSLPPSIRVDKFL